MRGFIVWLIAALAVWPAVAAEKVSLEEYRSRRAALRDALGDAVTILFGRTEKEHGDLRTGFFQEPNFYYLTGWSEPGAILLITPSSEMLLLPRRDKEQEKWTGAKLGPDEPGISEA
ncbi:MAG: aminopeptidase P N-terminal domain-containing protein, partial [Bryobacteraceae bacterium]